MCYNRDTVTCFFMYDGFTLFYCCYKSRMEFTQLARLFQNWVINYKNPKTMFQQWLRTLMTYWSELNNGCIEMIK